MRVFASQSASVRSAIFGWTAAFAMAAALLLPVTASRGGSIFDDDWTPPAKRPQPTKPPAIPATTPATPANRPDTAPAAPQTAIPSRAAQPAVAPPVHRTLPDRASRGKVRKLFEEVFADYLKDRAPAARKKLAQRLLDEGIKAPEGTADQFVLLTGAMQAAEDALNIRISFAAAEELAKSYDVDELSTKVEAATKVFSGAPSPLMSSVYNVDALLTVSDQLAAQDDFVNLGKIESALRHGLSGIRDVELKEAVRNQIQEMTSIREAQEKIGPALEKLKRSPGDPTINAFVGRYLCFERGRWERGLPLLAKSNDVTGTDLAVMELRRPAEPKAIAALGDGWFDEAAKLSAPDRPKVLEHAAGFYRVAGPGLTGLRKLSVEKRLAEIPDTRRRRRVDMLETFDPATSVRRGTWRVQDGCLTAEPEGAGLVEFNYEPPAEYDFLIGFTIPHEKDCVVQVCYANGHQFEFMLGGWGNTIAAFERVNGLKDNNNNTTRKRKNWLSSGERYVAVVKVRKTGVEAYLDGQLVTDWKTDYSDMSLDWGLSRPNVVGLGEASNDIRVDLAEIIEVTGEGKLLSPW
jgi:hypothetical protein